MVPLNAVLLAMLINARSAEQTVTTITATFGIVVRLSIYLDVSQEELGWMRINRNRDYLAKLW